MEFAFYIGIAIGLVIALAIFSILRDLEAWVQSKQDLRKTKEELRDDKHKTITQLSNIILEDMDDETLQTCAGEALEDDDSNREHLKTTAWDVIYEEIKRDWDVVDFKTELKCRLKERLDSSINTWYNN